MKISGLLAALMLVAICSPTLAQECDPSAVSIATEPAPSQLPSKRRDGAKKLAEAPGAADIVLLGDSILEGWDKSPHSDFGDNKVWNFSVGADRTQQLLWRLDQVDLARVDPTRVVLLIGTNNLADDGTPACAITAGVHKIVDKVRGAWPEAKLFLVTVPPRGDDFRRNDAVRTELNQTILAMGETDARIAPVVINDNVLTCGMYDDPALLPSKEKRCLAPDVAICTNYQKDNIHLQRQGYVNLLASLEAASMQKFGEDFLSKAPSQ